MGQRMVHFSEYSGRVEEIFLPKDGLTELGTNTSIADAEWAEQDARRANSQPGWCSGRTCLGRQRGRGIRERPPLQALLQVERPTGRDVGEGQGGDETGEAKAAWATYWRLRGSARWS